MQPIQNVNLNIQSPSPAQGMGLGQVQAQGQPETGEFDFMNYLLGLQDPQTPTTPDALLALGVPSPEKGATDLSRDPLQAMFAAIPNMPQMNPALLADLPKPVVNPSLNGGGEAQVMAKEATKPQWISSEDLMKATNALVPSSTEAVDAMNEGNKAVKSEEKGIPLEGFQKVADQAGVDLSISRQGQQLAAKKYAANKAEAEAKTVAPVVEAARPRAEKAIETSSSPVAQAALPEVKPEAVSQKKNGDTSSLEINGFSSSSSVHKAEVAQTAIDNKAASGSTGPVALPEVMSQVQTLVQKGGGEMTVALDPPDLGRIQVKVTTRGNRVEVEMRSESVQAKNALESHFADLKSSMQSQDLHLAKLDVQVHHDPMSFSGQSFAGMNDGRHQAGNTQGGPNQGQGGRRSSFSQGNRGLEAVSSVPQAIVRSASTVGGNGRVDLRI